MFQQVTQVTTVTSASSFLSASRLLAWPVCAFATVTAPAGGHGRLGKTNDDYAIAYALP